MTFKKIMFFLKSVGLLFLTLLRNILHHFARRDFVIREVLGSFKVYSFNQFCSQRATFSERFLKFRSSVTRSTFYPMYQLG